MAGSVVGVEAGAVGGVRPRFWFERLCGWVMMAPREQAREAGPHQTVGGTVGGPEPQVPFCSRKSKQENLSRNPPRRLCSPWT